MLVGSVRGFLEVEASWEDKAVNLSVGVGLHICYSWTGEPVQYVVLLGVT